MPEFNINTDAAVIFTNQLEKLHRSGLPLAIRETLNSLAFKVKSDTLKQVTDSEFTVRQKNFFKATSRVERAKGFDIKSMNSKIGFLGNSQAIDDLEQQEYGGKIKGRSFIPMTTSRTGNSKSKGVRKKFRVSQIRNVSRIKTRKNFVRKVKSSGIGSFVLYKETLFQVKNISRGNIKLLPVYSYKKNRSVTVKPTKFMLKSTELSYKNIDSFYVEAAEKQIKRLLK